jgi:hypothetical protein
MFFSALFLGCETILWVEFYPVARYFQKSSQRPPRMQHLRAMRLLAPLTVQKSKGAKAKGPPIKRPSGLNI